MNKYEYLSYGHLNSFEWPQITLLKLGVSFPDLSFIDAFEEGMRDSDIHTGEYFRNCLGMADYEEI